MTTTTRRPIPVERPARGRRKWPWITLAAIAVIAGVLLHSPWLSVGDIEIRGADQADVAGRVAATGVGEGAILVWVDTGAVADAVLADPWVRDVLVDRVWPDRLLVEVLEHRPALWVEGVRGWMLVSRDGTVLERTAVPGTGLPVASMALPDLAPGDRPSDPAWHELVELVAVLPEDIAAGIVLEMRGPEMWTEIHGHPVRFGHPIDLAAKGLTLAALIETDLPPQATLDLVAPRRPAVVPVDAGGEVEAEG